MPGFKPSYSSYSQLLPVAGFLIVAHTVDIASTIHASPHLIGEWNILERHFQLGFPGILAAKALWALLAILGYDFYLRHRTTCYPNSLERHLGFYRYFAFGPPQARRASDRVIARLRLGVHLGYLLVGLHLLAIWAAVDNTMLAAGQARMLENLSASGYHVMQGVIVGALTLARFYATNHQRYCLLRCTDGLPGRLQVH